MDETQTSRSSIAQIPKQLLPGLLLTTAIALVGMGVSEWIGKDLLGLDKSPVSGIMMAIIFGLLAGNLIHLPTIFRPGLRFTLRQLLRSGIILLGIRLSLGDILRLGALGIPLILACISGAILVARWLSRRLRISATMSAPIAVGTSICGATAIVATAPAIDAKEEEIAYAIANITVFGLLAMFIYPLLAHMLFMDAPTEAGLFLGTSIHETAQVAGGGLIYAERYSSDDVLDSATVTKLVRNVLMAVIIPMMAYWHKHEERHRAGAEKQISLISLFPIFIFGFLAMAGVRTIGDNTLEHGHALRVFNATQWDSVTHTIRALAEILLTIAMAGVGLSTNLNQLRGLGLTPFYVGLGASLSVGILSLIGIVSLKMLGLT